MFREGSANDFAFFAMMCSIAFYFVSAGIIRLTRGK